MVDRPGRTRHVSHHAKSRRKFQGIGGFIWKLIHFAVILRHFAVRKPHRSRCHQGLSIRSAEFVRERDRLVADGLDAIRSGRAQ